MHVTAEADKQVFLEQTKQIRAATWSWNCADKPGHKRRRVGGTGPQGRPNSSESEKEEPEEPEVDKADVFMMTAGQRPPGLWAEYLASWTSLSEEERFAEKERNLRPLAEEESAVDTILTEDSVTFLSKQSRTKMPDCRTCMLDIGSVANVIGINTLKELEQTMAPHGHSVTYTEKAVPPNLSGVGAGAARCTQTATISVAVQFEEQAATSQTYHANVATGSGSDVPAIMGKEGASTKDGLYYQRR